MAKPSNKQPLYHRAEILFTATEAYDEDRLRKALDFGLRSERGYVDGTLEVEAIDHEAGDPADLM